MLESVFLAVTEASIEFCSLRSSWFIHNITRPACHCRQVAASCPDIEHVNTRVLRPRPGAQEHHLPRPRTPSGILLRLKHRAVHRGARPAPEAIPGLPLQRVVHAQARRVPLAGLGVGDRDADVAGRLGRRERGVEAATDAAEAGADYTIVIISGYFAGALANNRKALKAFWSEVAEKSPIPVIIYNCEFF